MSSCSHYTDSDLLLLLGNENRSAFTEIYNRYWSQVYATAFHFAKNSADAEDAVQQVFLSLWNKRNDLHHINSLSAYLAAAARYYILDQLYRRERYERLLSSHPIQHMSAEFRADTRLQQRIINDTVHRSVEMLPEKTRIIFRFSRELSYSNQKIAGELNISVKTVEAHITKALKAIRMSLNHLGSFFF